MILAHCRLIEKHGLAAMHEPHIKHLEGKLWEMRMKERRDRPRHLRDRIGRTWSSFTRLRRRRRRLPLVRARPLGIGQRCVMGIPVKRIKKRWMKEPGFKEGYDALEEEFSLASMLIEARTRARLSQRSLRNAGHPNRRSRASKAERANRAYRPSSGSRKQRDARSCLDRTYREVTEATVAASDCSDREGAPTITACERSLVGPRKAHWHDPTNAVEGATTR